mgnify:CR=1 FL=1
MDKLAQTILDTLGLEKENTTHIAYGTIVSELKEVSRSYKEARMALDVGKIFSPEKDVIAYSSLGIGRLIYQLPTQVCDMFVGEIFGEESLDSIDDETLNIIRTFFENVPQEQPHPYPFGFDYWDAVKLIEPQLDDPARVEEIYQMMVPIWEATPQDDRMYALRQQAFENLTAFRQGTFTLFAEHKEPVVPTMPQAKAYDLGYGYLGNGVTVWNRLEEEHGDYKTVAHIAPDRTVTFYEEEMPQAVREEIQRIADTSEMTISATQDAPVFTVPPRAQEPVSYTHLRAHET